MQVVKQLQRVPVDQLEVDADNVRTHYEKARIEELREALTSALSRGEQYINPPTVYPVGRDRYRVKTGNCRVLAASGVTDGLIVRVVEPPKDSTERILDQLSENMLQGGLSPMDTARALRKMKDEGNLSLGELAHILRERGIVRSRQWVKINVDLTTLHPMVQEVVESGQIGVSLAAALTGLPGAQQVELLERVLTEKPTLTEFHAMIGRGPSELGADLDAGSPAWLNRNPDVDQYVPPSSAAGSGRRPSDPAHRTGELSRRWEIVPLLALSDAQSAALKELNEEWAHRASSVERFLAQEAVLLGKHGASKAMELASRATSEAGQTRPEVITALNQIGRIIDQPDLVPPGSAVAEFLRMRVQAMLDRLTPEPVA